MRAKIAIVFLSIGLSACWPFTALFKGGSKGLRLKTTQIPANDANWAKLESTTTQLGWTFVRGGSNDYRLRVKPTSGGEIQMDFNRTSHHIDFVCEGPIKDSDKCIAAANQLFGPAFDVVVKE